MTDSPGFDSTRDMNPPSDPPIILNANGQALRRLISPSVLQDELPSLIETIFSNVGVTDIADCLQGSDAQTFIDIIDQVRHHPLPSPGHWLIGF